MYVVLYVEVAPASTRAAAVALRQYRDAARADGVERLDVLQESGRPDRFAIVEAWTGARPLPAPTARGARQAVRERLGPLLVSPCDERLHDGLSIGPAPTSVPGATYVLTHADAVPPAKDDAVRLLTELAEASRREDGNVRFDVLQQQSRKNHLTLLEAWSDTRAREAHVLAAHTRRFRAEFQAMSGSLYDERLYAALD